MVIGRQVINFRKSGISLVKGGFDKHIQN